MGHILWIWCALFFCVCVCVCVCVCDSRLCNFAGNFDEFCEEFGVTYQYCCSQRLNKKYLMDVASEIMFKVIKYFSVDLIFVFCFT
jgi:DNA-binding transcriptional regulator of glucitol operon